MSDPLYLLDTGVLLALVRGNTLGAQLDERFGLRATRQRPLICVVTHGEIRVLAHRNNWGGARQAAPTHALKEFVTVDINHSAVIDAYVDVEMASTARPEGARNMGKNDVWIAAAAKAAGATLLTLDSDFAHLIPNVLTGTVIAVPLAT